MLKIIKFSIPQQDPAFFSLYIFPFAFFYLFSCYLFISIKNGKALPRLCKLLRKYPLQISQIYCHSHNSYRFHLFRPNNTSCHQQLRIRYSISHAEPGDVIAIIGKGHEDYQILAGGVKIHFDEREVVADALKELEAEGR